MSDIPSGRGPTVKKLYYSIGEVSDLTGVPAHVLRYWESEFAELRPKKGRSGNRTYQERDIEIIESIRNLLYEQKFTIAGARVRLRELRDETKNNADILAEVRAELQSIIQILNK